MGNTGKTAEFTLYNRLARRGITAHKAKSLMWVLVRFGLLFGLSFIIVYPFLAKISSMFMSPDDIRDPIVWFVPRSPTLSNITNVIKYGNFWEALRNTAFISLMCAILQTASATMTAYGLARFKFRFKGLLMAFAALTIVVPPQTIYVSLFLKFRFPDLFGILRMSGIFLPSLIDSIAPMALLSATALGLKNGLYILVLTQIFRNIPKELSEAAHVDGAGMWRTFWSVNMPQARPMMVSVFLLAFSWQWTDTFYSGLFFRATPVLLNVISKVRTIGTLGVHSNNTLAATLVNTAVMLIIFPLILVFLAGQRYIIQGVERSGMVG